MNFCFTAKDISLKAVVIDSNSSFEKELIVTPYSLFSNESMASLYISTGSLIKTEIKSVSKNIRNNAYVNKIGKIKYIPNENRLL